MTGMPLPQPPVGRYRPARITVLESAGPAPALVDRLRVVTGLSAAFSDGLDEIAVRTAVPASVVAPLRSSDVLIGRALTLRYLPLREVAGPSRLAHLTACEGGRPGDVLVISAPPSIPGSVLGGKAAAAIVGVGLAGIVVQGAVRDLDEIDATGLQVWSTATTLITGRGRLEAVEINGPVEICGVQCAPGDIVVADRSGVVFVPVEVFEALATVILAG